MTTRKHACGFKRASAVAGHLHPSWQLAKGLRSRYVHTHIAIRLAMALTWCESRSLLLVLFSMLPRLEA